MTNECVIDQKVRAWCLAQMKPSERTHFVDTEESHFEMDIGEHLVIVIRKPGEERTGLFISEPLWGHDEEEVSKRLGPRFVEFMLIETCRRQRVELSYEDGIYYLSDYLYDDAFTIDKLHICVRNIISVARHIHAELKKAYFQLTQSGPSEDILRAFLEK